MNRAYKIAGDDRMEIPMVKEKKMLPDLSQFRFRDTFISMEYPLHLLSPIQQVSRGGKLSDLSLIELGSALGMNVQQEDVQSSFERQQQRFTVYKRLYVGFSILGYFLIGVPAIILSFALVNLLKIPNLLNGPNPIYWVITFLIVSMAYQTAKRIVSVLLDRFYADTLSFVTCLYLLANLTKKYSLAHPKNRKELLVRIRALRKYLILLPHQFSTSDLPPNSLAPTQFRYMAEFTEEKENQIIAPYDSSQVDLFVELRAFLGVLLTANYGEFEYKNGAKTDEMPPLSNGALAGIMKLLATLFPLVLLILMYFLPSQFEFLGIEKRVVALISLAWLLLAIDANLKLGVVDRVSSLAKAFKDLG